MLMGLGGYAPVLPIAAEGFSENFAFASGLKRAGSCKESFGARGAKLEEPFCGIETYPVVWREPKFDLAELARFRWINGLSYKELASRFGKTPNAIECHCRLIRKRHFEVGLSKTEQRHVRKAAGL